MFLPTSPREVQLLGWKSLDIILVTGDAYIDSPHIGVAVIGKVLLNAGYRVGIIPQPDTSGQNDIARLGEPVLFWGVTSGCMDSMISNYTATLKKRNQDDLTAGGRNMRRPDRAVIAYVNLIRRSFRKTRPIVIGGIEASLRRVSHYDYWSDSVRRSVLFDSKADFLVYGMGEKTVVELAGRLKKKKPVMDIRGLCYKSTEKREGYLELPSHPRVARDKAAFTDMFTVFYRNSDPVSGQGLCQKQDTRYLIQNPPPIPATTEELDRIYELNYERRAHPCHEAEGPVRALETIRFSIASHRGCFGECDFCAIAVHQGRRIAERSESSIVREARHLTHHPDFKGIIQDVGGPTANMYGMHCRLWEEIGACRNRRCLTPSPCRRLSVNHRRQIRLLEKLRNLPRVKKVFIGSGIRHDLILGDGKYGQDYLEAVIGHHVSGQMKIAPEHSEKHILDLMGKPDAEMLKQFIDRFRRLNREAGKKQFLTCYFIAAYPGCTLADMQGLKRFVRESLGFAPEQAQIFTPSPSTPATLMYYTEKSFPGGEPLFVEKSIPGKEKQKKALLS
ncbi:MAG: YgiQ family radical SAM protein [Thermodesulfobacteriota bacterium]